jgi:hypothetical protein
MHRRDQSLFQRMDLGATRRPPHLLSLHQLPQPAGPFGNTCPVQREPIVETMLAIWISFHLFA